MVISDILDLYKPFLSFPHEFFNLKDADQGSVSSYLSVIRYNNGFKCAKLEAALN